MAVIRVASDVEVTRCRECGEPTGRVFQVVCTPCSRGELPLHERPEVGVHLWPCTCCGTSTANGKRVCTRCLSVPPWFRRMGISTGGRR